MPPKVTASRRRKMLRGYQRALSKQRMKLSKYRLSGAIHRKGTEAMFCEMWLVMASSSADAIAARVIQTARKRQVGRSAEEFSTFASAANPRTEMAIHA